MDTALAISRFQELREKDNMRKAVSRLGRSSYFAFKMSAISVKLTVNVTLGLLLYLVVVALFDMLTEHMELFNGLTNATMSLTETSYLTMEKILWREGRLSLTAYSPSLESVLQSNDAMAKSLLDQTEKYIAETSRLVDTINRDTSNSLWYTSRYMPVLRLNQNDPSLLSGKEGISTILSTAIVHVGKPTSYYTRSNEDLTLFFQNVRSGLFDSTVKFLNEVNSSLTNYSQNLKTLLLVVLLSKVGVGLIFVWAAFVLFFKENKRKEEVFALFYSFMPSDVRNILKQNERLISAIVAKDFVDSETGLIENRLLEKQESQTEAVQEEEADDDQNVQIMIAKRNKSRGRLDKAIDFNKFFIIFFAVVNLMYFIFLYFWNLSVYQEYSNLTKLSRENNLLTLEIGATVNKFMTTLYMPMSDSDASISNLTGDISNFMKYRKHVVTVGITYHRSSLTTSTAPRTPSTRSCSCFTKTAAA